MRKTFTDLSGHVKRRLRRLRRSTSDAGLALRCQMVLHACEKHSSRAIAQMLGCSRSCVSRVIRRFEEHGGAGLYDRREDNGVVKVDDSYLGQLQEVVSKVPLDFGYHRPTWTRELLVAVMRQRTGVSIHPATMSRALKRIGARRGRPKPVVACPWSKRAKNKRLRSIEQTIAQIGDDQVVVYADEVDIHLNPKIGLDWMNRGQQKEVLTPGKNEKRYLAGALDVHSHELICVEGSQKNSMLFIELLHELRHRYPDAKTIHIILDNYRIHKSDITNAVIDYRGGKIALHFLPPYCPDENKIERCWLDLHAEVTRNHRCRSMKELMRQVRRFIRNRNSRHAASTTKRKAA